MNKSLTPIYYYYNVIRVAHVVCVHIKLCTNSLAENEKIICDLKLCTLSATPTKFLCTVICCPPGLPDMLHQHHSTFSAMPKALY
jgi:hypothetical protein